MIRKRIGAGILLATFVAAICLSWPIWSLVGQYLETENHEKRELAARPALSPENYAAYPSEFDRYVNDHLPFRNSLINLNTQIDYFLFHRATNPNVILGKDNWLFYDNPGDGNPIANYRGEDLVSAEELSQIAWNFMQQRDFLAAQGREFVIFFAPNKERVYPEYMPERFGAPAEDYKLKQLVEYLRTYTDLNVVYPCAQLMEAKSQVRENLYSKTDTHWNDVGGYIGARALLDAMGVDMPEITDARISIHTGENSAGDLADMLNLSKQLRFADHAYTVTGYEDHGMETLANDFNGAIITHATGADPRRVYVIRDSFASHMIPYIGSQFDDCCFRHVVSYSYDDLVAQDPDVVVMVFVERDLSLIQSFAIAQ